MGRFLVIVILLVVIAVFVNRAMQDPVNELEPAAEASNAAASKVEASKVEASNTEASNTDVPNVEAAKDAKPAAVAGAAPQPSTPGDAPVAAAVDDPAGKPVATKAPVKAAAAGEPETVLLGSGPLLTGIAGEGDLTMAQIEGWLADPKNHVVLKPELPLGLAAGAAEIKGIDKNPLTRAKIELGRQLYFDTRLSSDNTISCASCHDPDSGYAKETQFGVGVSAQEGGRNSPTAYNRILSGPQFWDGRAESLEAQAVGPIANAIEMGNTHESCVASLQGIEGYTKQFQAIFDDGVTIDNVGKALASFERAVVTGPAPWDYYQQVAAFEKSYVDDLEFIKEEKVKDDPELDAEDLELWDEYTKLKQPLTANPISASAIRGGELFFSDKAGCTACHLGANFTDEKYHNLGVGMDTDAADEEIDWGRFSETKDDKDRGAFKTPTVRNVALTGPYMHDGSQKTLLEVVEWYAKGGHPNPHLSEKIKKLELTDQDKQDLVAFMAEGLKSELPQVERGRLPQ
jgi:cytochrome c peroxidase